MVSISECNLFIFFFVSIFVVVVVGKETAESIVGVLFTTEKKIVNEILSSKG